MSEADIPLTTPNSSIHLYPLSKQLKNGVAIVGRDGQFLKLPPEGLQLIAWLDEGLNPTEARKRFETIYTPFPDTAVLEVNSPVAGAPELRLAHLAPRSAPWWWLWTTTDRGSSRPLHPQGQPRPKDGASFSSEFSLAKTRFGAF